VRATGNVAGVPEPQWEGPFLRACRGARVPRVPIWLMRQAGRYMAEYRAVRSGRDFLDLCRSPRDAARVTLEARERLGTDAAIIFADILLVLDHLGLELHFAPGDGPVIDRPIGDGTAIEDLADPEDAAHACAYVADAIAETRRGLPEGVPLIGFCGAPFTLASYACEGGSSRQFPRTRDLMYQDSETWHRFCAHLVRTLIPYCRAQVAAGAATLQVFDSWAGALTAEDYREFVLPHLCDLVAGLPEGIPVIVFGTGTDHLLEQFAETGCDVVGIDAVTDPRSAWDRLGGSDAVSIQGNLDPGLLLAPRGRLLAAADRLLAAVGERPGFIFNLGHGVFKETDPEQVVALVAHVHGWREGGRLKGTSGNPR